jgi:nicotinamidase-related amidase
MTVRIHGKDVPETLEEILAPSSTALLVIDMQNDFCSPGGSTDRAGGDLMMFRQIIPRIADAARIARTSGVPVIHVKMITLPDGASDSVAWIRLKLRANKNYGRENSSTYEFTLAGTWGAEIVTELQPDKQDVVLEKFRSSALHATSLDEVLRARGVQTVVVVGCTTEGCVESTVRDLTFHDYIPVLLADCVASDHADLHEASLAVMSAYRADIATLADLLRCWSGSRMDSQQGASV